MNKFTKESLRTYLGARMAYNFHVNERVIVTPELRLFWQHEFLQDLTLSSQLNGGKGPGFTYVGEQRDRDSIFGGAGIGLQLGARFYANTYYHAEFEHGNDMNHNISISATLKF